MAMALPQQFSNLRIPVIGSPLFIISNPDLVIAQCKAGVIGSFPALNARPAPVLEEWLKRITEELDRHNQANPDSPAAPFAVNQIVHKSNERLMHDVEMCVKYKVPVVITSLGAVKEVNDAAHSYGGVVMHDVINNRFAKKAIEKGADGLIAVAAGAGGHAGTLSPFALIQEIREWFDGPLALSGSIATGGAVLAAQAMGADFGYIAPPSSQLKKPTRTSVTSKRLSTMVPMISSTPTCLRACTVTISRRPLRLRALIPRTCP